MVLLAYGGRYSRGVWWIESPSVTIKPQTPAIRGSALTSPLFFFQRQAKYSENKLKCTKARNDYLLNLAATNAAISKYYIHDVSDLIDVSTWSVGLKGTHSPAGANHQLKEGLAPVLGGHSRVEGKDSEHVGPGR